MAQRHLLAIENGVDQFGGQLRHPSRAGGLPAGLPEVRGAGHAPADGGVRRAPAAEHLPLRPVREPLPGPPGEPGRGGPGGLCPGWVRGPAQVPGAGEKTRGPCPFPRKRKCTSPSGTWRRGRASSGGWSRKRPWIPWTPPWWSSTSPGGDPPGGGFRPGGHRKPPHRRGLLPERRGGRRHRLRAHHPAVQALPGGHRPAAQPGRG